MPTHERVGMEFQAIGAVFKIVIHAVHHPGKFAGFADWDEPRRERLCDRDPENESSAFGTDDEVDPLAPVRVGHQFHRERECPRIREQRREILVYHAWLGEIGDLFDQGIEFVVRFGALHETIIHAMPERFIEDVYVRIIPDLVSSSADTRSTRADPSDETHIHDRVPD